MNCYILRMGELFLKGKNKKQFESKLRNNIRRIFKDKEFTIINRRNRIYVYSRDKLDFRRVFGITSYSNSVKIDLKDNKDIESIKEKALDYLINLSSNGFKTFKLDARRITKDFFLTSPEINKELADFLSEKIKKDVDMKRPDILLGVEIYGKEAYIFHEKVRSFGGLPVGIEGASLLLIEDRYSILAGLLMMKRGVSIIPAAFDDTDISLLQRYSPDPLNLKIIRSISEITLSTGIRSVITNKHLSRNISDLDNLFTLKPLAAFTEEEIERLWGEFNESNT